MAHYEDIGFINSEKRRLADESMQLGAAVNDLVPGSKKAIELNTRIAVIGTMDKHLDVRKATAKRCRIWR